MNPELYTDEFRSFKFLKSSPEQVSYFKKQAENINNVQPWADINDPNYVWPNRLEFVEQLIDMQGETLYIVEPGELMEGKRSGTSDYSRASIHEIKNAVVCRGNPMMYKSPPAVRMDDVADMEDNSKNNVFYLCYNERKDFIKVTHLGLVPVINPSYVAVFSTLDAALRYQIAITQFLRNRNDAVSAISSLF